MWDVKEKKGQKKREGKENDKEKEMWDEKEKKGQKRREGKENDKEKEMWDVLDINSHANEARRSRAKTIPGYDHYISNTLTFGQSVCLSLPDCLCSGIPIGR